MAHKWFEIKALAPTAEAAKVEEVYIFGNIGDKWSEDGVIASEMVQAVDGMDADEITLRINSYGGSLSDGVAIYNAFRRHRAKIHVVIEGIAASMAGYIAMAGDRVTIAKNAQLMIHAPWAEVGGNAGQLREFADVLDRHGKSLASGYAEKSGQSIAEIMALLMSYKNHWYSADEAVKAGFADTVGEEIAVAASLANSFDLSKFKQAAPVAVLQPPVSQPAAAAVTPKEASMPGTVLAAGQPAVTPFARTKDDNTQVIAMFKPFAANPAIVALQTDVLADPGLTIEAIQARLLAEMGKGAAPANPQGAHPVVQTVADETDKQRAAAVSALLVRAGVEQDATVKASMTGNPFRGSKLLDLAKASLERAGIKSAGMGQMEIVSAAFTQGTSDFPVLLENAMHKSLQSSYARAALTWNRFCATGSVGDFRAHNRYRTGSFGALDSVNELGEFTNKSIPDGEKASITAATKGNIINLSRQAIINDDLGAFIGLSAMLGRAAARTIEADVYALLGLNSGLGPTMGDGLTLFHATHGNIGAAAAISMASVDADRVLMASQRDVSGNDYLDLRPAVMLLPIGLGGTARGINAAQYDPDTANKLQKPNVVNGLYRDIVDTPRLTGTRRYSFADAGEAAVLEVAFLDGASEPVIETQNGFDVDGARFKVRLDYGIAAVDYRGAVTNAGA